jgi:hypothetical protein
MKTLILLTALPFAMSHGCAFGNDDGSGKVISENRTVSTFNGISLECHANVYFTQGDEQSVRVEAEDNIMSHLKTEVKNKSLEIKMDKDFNNHETINVYVTVKELCMLDLAGSGKMIGKSHINCDDMSFGVAGSGSITADIRSLAVKISVSGSGSLNVAGATTSMDIKVAGSGGVNAKELQSVKSTVSVSGSGSTTINTKDELNVSITGSGGVKYLGEPAKLNTNITGSGRVTKI